MHIIYKIDNGAAHPIRMLFSDLYVPGRATQLSPAAHPLMLQVPRARAVQYSRSFVPACVDLWNLLDDSAYSGDGLGNFKSAVNHALLVATT